MPILKRENDIFPADLLENKLLLEDEARKWWCIYTMSRREKDLMRKLAVLNVPYYGPMIPKRNRSSSGRLRTSFVPLFPNYVFLFGDEADRFQAMKTNCVSRYTEVPDRIELLTDMRQIFQAISSNLPLTPESRLEPGQSVRVRSGPFRGYEGSVIRREGKTRLLLFLRFLEQGVSMEMDEGLLAPI